HHGRPRAGLADAAGPGRPGPARLPLAEAEARLIVVVCAAPGGAGRIRHHRGFCLRRPRSAHPATAKETGQWAGSEQSGLSGSSPFGPHKRFQAASCSWYSSLSLFVRSLSPWSRRSSSVSYLPVKSATLRDNDFISWTCSICRRSCPALYDVFMIVLTKCDTLSSRHM